MLRVLVLTVTLVALALGTAAGVSAAMGDPQVAAMQTALVAHGTYGGSIDGHSGPQTEAAIAAFQVSKGLAQTGLADTRTVELLGGPTRAPSIKPALKIGDRGWDVAALQFTLAWHGFPSGAIDGDFGPRLERALLRFQRRARLAIDGVAGPGTFQALERRIPKARIRLSWPVDATTGDTFGPRGTRFHAGLDFPAQRGQGVFAAAAGHVSYAAVQKGGHGRLIVVRHRRGVSTAYAHLSRIDVSVGQRVRRGERIGLIGSSGRSTGPHLHFEAYARGALVDPLRSLARR